MAYIKYFSEIIFWLQKWENEILSGKKQKVGMGITNENGY